jgi:chromosome segregation ATPase
MDDVTKIILGAIGGAIISFVITKFLNRGEDSLKNFGDLMAEKFNSFSKDIANIIKAFDELKNEKKESKKELEGYKSHIDLHKIEIEGIKSKMHQLSQAIGDVDLDAQNGIKHNKEMFDIYKGTIDSYRTIIEGLLKDRK